MVGFAGLLFSGLITGGITGAKVAQGDYNYILTKM